MCVVEMICILMFMCLLLFIGWIWCFCNVCSSFICSVIGILLILFKNKVLLLVFLNRLGWVVIVLVNVFLVWLNSLDLSKFLGNVL